jgi:signal transduction histidine kinase
LEKKVNASVEDLKIEIVRLKKINAALMTRVERSIDGRGTDFSLFEGNVLIAQKVRDRTKELKIVNDAVLSEKVKLGRVLTTLLGRTIVFDHELRIVDSFQGAGPSISIEGFDTIDKCFNKKFSEKLHKALSSGLKEIPVSFNFQLENRPDESRHFSCYLSYFGQSEFVISIVDVSAAASTENQLRQQEIRLIESSKLSALGEMAGGVAHEINNPLAIIMGCSEQLMDLLSEDPVDKAVLTKRVEVIKKTTYRIASIVEGLRTFSRDSSGDQSIRVSLTHLVDSTISLCRERFRNMGIDLIVDPVPAGLHFKGRETEMSQVLINLLNNAYDAIKEKQVKWVRVVASEDINSLELRVIDCGSGVPMEIQEKIFQPFFTTKPIGMGTGLGLSISHGIVKNHGGQLKIDSQNANSCFVISLPKG